MPRETNAAKRERAIEVCERLNRRYGPVECFLDHENPFRLLIAVLLSAQTTDAQVNVVLADGEIVEDGTHAQLVEAGGEYASLWGRQTGAFLEA